MTSQTPRRLTRASRIGTACLFIIPTVCASFALSGCLESDVLVNKVLNQENGEIDYSNPQKKFIYDKNAKLNIDDAASKYSTTAKNIEKVLEDKPVYSKDAAKKDKAEKAQLGKQSDQDKDASKVSDSKSGNKEGTDKSSDGKGKGTAGKNTGGKSDKKSDTPGDDSTKKGDDSLISYSQYGDLEDLPTDINTVCATGEAATMVLSLAGEGHLIGSSSDFINGATTSKVFASRGINEVKTCWKNDGSSPKDADINAIIKLKPDAVITISGSASITRSDYDKLTAKGIRVIVLPSLASDANIKLAAQAVGKAFSDATDGASTKNATEYKKAVDGVLDKAKSTHGGKVTSYAETDFNNIDETTTTGGTQKPTDWTVFISGWDKNATVTASFNGKALFKDTGVAYVKTGWKTSPLSYYMGCGGVLNNAAAYGITEVTKGYQPFLIYNENQVSYKWGGLSSSIKVGHNNGTYKTGANAVLSNGYDAAVSGDNKVHYLGSSDFKTVIVPSKTVKKELQAAREKKQGLYSAGSYQELSGTKGYGHNIDGKLLYTYAVTANASRDDVDYDVLVNPSGMAGSWSEGNMESCLESLWIASVYHGYSQSSLKSDVSNFYETVYGYTPSNSELEKILDGSYFKEGKN